MTIVTIAIDREDPGEISDIIDTSPGPRITIALPHCTTTCFRRSGYAIISRTIDSYTQCCADPGHDRSDRVMTGQDPGHDWSQQGHKQVTKVKRPCTVFLHNLK